MKRASSQAGFTMIEVMIAVLLSAIAVIGIVGLYTVESRASTMSRRKTEAAELAQDKVEELRTMVAPTAAGSGSETNLDEHGETTGSGPSHIFTRSWTITPQGNPAGEWYLITVTVSWENNSVIVRAERSST